MKSHYLVGTGIAEVTDPAVGLTMQGMADPSQRITGVESPLYARAFVVSDFDQKRLVVIVNADIWAVSSGLKGEVLRRLEPVAPGVFREENVLLSGTHTHSGPGGFTEYELYEHSGKGFDPHTFECIVHGMVTAIARAYTTMAPGDVRVEEGKVDDCGRQRSRDAYLRNPEDERRHQPDTDPTMLLLKFTRMDGDSERAIGVLNWYAIHPTDRGQKNTLVCGDNKGDASMRFEKAKHTDYSTPGTFVAAFANSSCGDVSGNVEFNRIPNGTDDKWHMEKHGRAQYEKAQQLFDAATERLRGSIDFRHVRVEMANVTIPGVGRTRSAALGLAFAAGSTEDSEPVVEEFLGVPVKSVPLREGLAEGEPPMSTDILYRAARDIFKDVLKAVFGSWIATRDFIDAHHPKPLILAPGLMSPPLTPQVLPLQILKIGQLAVIGIPAEITTMAGRRLKDRLAKALYRAGVSRVALAAYANDYAQYITTREEYGAQHYEGASTPFGPHTLEAFAQEFGRLVTAMADERPIVEKGPAPTPRSATTRRRVTLRNESGQPVTLKMYNQRDWLAGTFMGTARKTYTLPAGADQSDTIPDGHEGRLLVEGGNWVEHIQPHDLVIVRGLHGFVTSYDPPHARTRFRKAARVAAFNHAPGAGTLLYTDIDATRSLYQSKQAAAGGRWSEPMLMGAHATCIAAAQNADGRWQVVYARPDNILRTKLQEGQDWSSEQGFGGYAACVTMARNQDGRLEVIYADEAGRIYHTSQSGPNQGFRAHTLFGGLAKAVAMAPGPDGRLVLFYRHAKDSRIYITSQTSVNGGWNARPTWIGGEAKAMTLWRRADGALALFYAGTNDRIYQVWQGSAGADWSKLQHSDAIGGLAKDLTVVTTADGRPEILYVGMDDRLYRTRQEANDRWSPHAVLTEERLKVASFADVAHV